MRRDVPPRERTRLGALYCAADDDLLASEKKNRLGEKRVITGVVGACAPTALSKFRSHRSLMVHPAPRMMNAPAPNRAMYFRGTDGGALCANEAMVIDQAYNSYNGTKSQKNLRDALQG